MKANYPNKMPTVHWDTLNTNYPVNRYHETGISSETIAREARGIPETLQQLQKSPLQEEINYSRNYNLTREFTKSQYTVDYEWKQGERKRFNKNNSCADNLYIYPPDTKLLHNPPDLAVFGLSETKNAFVRPSLSSRLVTDKDQFKHPASLPLNPPPIQPFRKDIEPLDTTYEGFEKYLDPYLTTSRLHHHPHSEEYLNRISNSKDVITYYTCAKQPWVRSPKPNLDKCLPLSRPKSMFDREKFKEDFREIRTHNKLIWTPGSFRTEVRDNYKQHESKIHNYEKDVQNFFQRTIAHL
ncbi:unnamed protein product [Pieris macdunnoughi]|uniref:Uncharacterized protein n=1 Tax=Pieris macdunnoughi TaxID=345717 RepID=A0A821RID4_9NEOP|nr:unnamed protein product [Pieris macdunnoughi]